MLKLNEHVAYGMPNKQRISVVKIQLDKDFLFVNVFGVLVVFIVLTPNPLHSLLQQFVGGWRNSNLVTLGIRKGPMLLKGNQAGRFLTLRY